MARGRNDNHELRELSRDLRTVYPDRLNRHVYAAVKKAAAHIKDGMKADLEASTHFKPIARSVSFDMRTGSAFGTGSIEAEIGPADGVGAHGQRAGPRRKGIRFNESDFGGGTGPAPLANIAYFGASRGGGGTVDDPEKHLDAEVPKFDAAMDQIIKEVFRT